MINNISIHGLRGFGKEQSIRFAIPNDKEGSGLTILVGANNSGKTTILEALRSFNAIEDNPPSFSERKRNMKCENGKVHLKLQMTNDDNYTIDTVESGGSTTKIIKKHGTNEKKWGLGLNIFVLPSRRFMEYEFYQDTMERDDYTRVLQRNAHNRTHSIPQFSMRLFRIQSSREEFDSLLKKVLGYDLEWTIEQNENGKFYLKLIVNGCMHSSEGLGDGIWSVFTICDALYDSKPGSVIAIDEPELSLHPAYQKKIIQLFKEYSANRQIIISTHSPYFVDMDSLVNGAFLYRTTKDEEGDIRVFSLSEESKKSVGGFLNDINQPHTLGTEAKEMFFLDDGIILTEGQEDVIMYNKALNQISIQLYGTFFGWGSGGASNITKIARILHDLGFMKVFAIFDGNSSSDLGAFKKNFPDYGARMISALDVRDKPAMESPAKEGIMELGGTLKDEYKDEVVGIFDQINQYLKRENL